LKFSPEYYTRHPARPLLDEMAARLGSLMFPSGPRSDFLGRPSNERGG
jgi:hypothetical protein